MKHIAVLLALLGCSLVARAQEFGDAAVQRARIKAERDVVESGFRARERDCYGKFAVNDCINAARTQRRMDLADLRRQEIALNDAERRRKAAERLQELQRSNAEAKPPAAGTSTTRVTEDRARPAKVEPEPAQPEAVKSKPAESSKVDANQASRSRKRHQERLALAEERKAKLEKRLAERTKPAAGALPVQP